MCIYITLIFCHNAKGFQKNDCNTKINHCFALYVDNIMSENIITMLVSSSTYFSNVLC